MGHIEYVYQHLNQSVHANIKFSIVQNKSLGAS